MTALTREARELLAQVSTATLTTCLYKRGFRNAWLQDVHPIHAPASNMVGPAFTLRMIPAREDLDSLDAYADPEHPQRKAIETCPEGHVLVIDSRKDARAASAGDILVARLQARGCSGIVTDGGLRDTPAIARLGFPAYHQRPSAPTGPILHHAADLQLPIACADVAVYPDDIIVGDGEGVIVLPAHLAEELAREAAAMTAYEDWVAARVGEGRRLFGIYPATAESRAEFEAWRHGVSH